MQEKMRQLQQQLEASQKASASSPPLVVSSADKQAELKPTTSKVTRAKSTAAMQKTQTRAGKGLLLTSHSRRKLTRMVYLSFQLLAPLEKNCFVEI